MRFAEEQVPRDARATTRFHARAGVRGRVASPEHVELAEALRENDTLLRTVKEQAIELALRLGRQRSGCSARSPSA
jgi:hypothetical protein